jgi:alginate O-acetyltransferase complex protein AlgI
MVFSSHLFLFYFLPFALLLYYASPRPLRHLTLLILSYVFYGWADPRFCLLLFGTTTVDYLVALAIERFPRRRRIFLTASIVSNLSVLGFFKYFNFFAATFGYHPAFRVILPLGISFYTFQSLSYVIDVYRGVARANRNFIDFAAFVSMFPQLVAGPIVRYADVADQLAARDHTLEKFARGVAFIAMGLAKKILLANPAGAVADACFDTPGLHALDAWYGAIAYAFQIYFDFSGYSDVAIGLGLMLGFTFPKNFDSPYRAKSLTDFWRRWHVSLSTWLRDYLYIPLGGNRRGAMRTCVNVAIVMLLGGLWHGAAWTFVIWGAIHGSLLILERLLRGRIALPTFLSIPATFLAVTIAWVFFRAPTFHAATLYLKSMFALAAPSPNSLLIRGVIFQPYAVATLILAAAVTWLSPQTWNFTRSLPAWKIAWATCLLWLSILVLETQAYNPFIYFIF